MSADDFFSILSGGLAFHGLALASLVLLTRRKNRLILTYSSLLVVLSLILVEYFVSYSGFEARFPHLIAMKIPLMTLIGPLYFLWASYRMGASFRPMDVMHAIPFALVLVLLLPFYLLSGVEKLQVAGSDGGSVQRNLYLVGTFLHLLSYILLTRKRVQAQRGQPVGQYSTNALHQGFLLLVSLFGLAIVYGLVGNTDIGLSRFLFITGLGVMINFLAYTLLRQPRSFDIRSDINREELRVLAQKVQSYLTTTKPYLVKGFNQSNLSTALGSNESYISRVFNDILKTSFTQYINQLRIEEAKRLLNDRDDKIYAIALDSGFASKNNFIRVFKQHTNCTPTEFRKLTRTNKPQFTN